MTTNDEIMQAMQNLDFSDIDGSDIDEDGEGDVVKEAREGYMYDIDSDDTDDDPHYLPESESDSSFEVSHCNKPSTSKRKIPLNTSVPEAKILKTNDGRKINATNPKTKNGTKVKKQKPPPVVWKDAEFKPEPLHLSSPNYLPVNSFGWDGFKYVDQYLDDKLFQLIVDKTNQTSIFKTGKPLLNLSDFQKWLGMSFIMSTIQYPQVHMYWMKKWRIPIIANTMPRDKYKLIAKSLKLTFDNEVSEEDRKADRLWKVRPLLERVRQGCLRQERSKHISVDEMMIPFQGQTTLKQYVPNKPNPIGLKAFVLANPNGIVCDFEIYQGQNTFCEERAKGFNLAESAVLTMTRTLVPGHIIYHDRYFSTKKLCEELLVRGMRSTGTLDRRFLPNDPLKSDKQMKKEGRGSIDMRVVENDQFCVVKWQDNKSVLMISSNEAQHPITEVKRWSKTGKRFVSVPQPQLIKSYNCHMGGVDLADRMLSYCPSRQRTRKWTQRVINHFLDLSITNSWLAFREDQVKAKMPIKKVIQLRKFKADYGEYLIELNTVLSDSESENSFSEDETNPRRVNSVATPSLRFRTHGSHLPIITKSVQNRCRVKNCTKKTSVKCSKCEVHLCLTADRNCYKTFHEK